MRKIVQLLVFLLPLAAMAQIPNPSFETWVQGTGYEEPEGWATANPLVTPFGATTTTSKVQDPSDGSLAVLMESKFIAIAGAVVPGVITTGDIAFDFQTGEVNFLNGAPFPYRPEAVSFDYKFVPGTSGSVADTAGVFMVLSRWDSATGQRDTIGEGGVLLTDSMSAYATENMLIQYTSTQLPDTILMVFSSSINPAAAQDGTIFLVDNIQVSFPTGVRTPWSALQAIRLYPNPARDYVTVDNTQPGPVTIVFYNVLGREVKRIQVPKGQQRIAIDQLDNGVYLYQVHNEKSELLHTGKLNVQ